MHEARRILLAATDLLHRCDDCGAQVLRAIDLYSGIGGWSAGLACAGIEVVEAYEIWPAAMRTYNANLGTDHRVSDVRKLRLEDLPEGISLVVGSPPCTEFSFSNRGGGGDLAEGLKDVVKFFEVVRHIGPTWWIMENVPRTAAMVRGGLDTPGHPLHEFRELSPDIRILDLSDFGLPQARARCFIGVFPFDDLDDMQSHQPRRTLGQAIAALGGPDVVDPLWGVSLKRSQLTEMEPELPLNAEQLRMNREAKRFHPVYNDMPFPDALDRPSRTVTATCTRVSRESIVVPADEVQSVRRLTVRERATLQGFPITYQFYGNSHSQKVKMIGNAVPPLFTYMVGLAAQGRRGIRTPSGENLPPPLRMPNVLPEVTPPHAVSTAYPARRRFRAALPGLRFKSGMRFQLSNEYDLDDAVRWSIQFFFGPSKDVRTVLLDNALHDRLDRMPMVSSAMWACRAQFEPVRTIVQRLTAQQMQRAWRQSEVGTGPYVLVDQLGQAGIALTHALTSACRTEVAEAVLSVCTDPRGLLASKQKLSQNAPAILAGLVLGSWFNRLEWAADDMPSRPAKVAVTVG